MEEMIETTVTVIEEVTEAVTPDIIREGEEVMEAIASGNVDTTVMTDFGKALIDFLPTVAIAILIFIAGKIIGKIILMIIDKTMGRTRIDKTAQGFLKSLLNIIFTAFAIIIALSTMGIPMTSIITTIGAAGVAVALALQNSLSNVAGGFLILFSRPFGKGDYIISNGVEGVVEDITIISTKLVTLDNKAIYIPNGMVTSNTITNFSREDKRRVDHIVNVSYEQDFREAVKVIQKVMENDPLILSDEEYFAKVSGLRDSSIEITVRAWTKTENYWTVYFNLIEDIRIAFIENGIEIPYNKLDVKIMDNK